MIMDMLYRENAPLTAEQWQQIDDMVVKSAKQILVGRRFLNLFGPLGAGIQVVAVDIYSNKEENIAIRNFIPMKQIHEDFKLTWDDLEYAKRFSIPLDLSIVVSAAQNCAKSEDEFIFWGCKESGHEGIMNSKGVNIVKKSDWSVGENAYSDIVKAMEMLIQKGFVGRFVLILSPDLFVQLQRIQPATGMLEYDRVLKLLNGNVYQTPVLKNGKSALICAEPSNLDLVIGQDMITAYVGNDKLDHEFRLFETIALRIKRSDSIVIFE